MHLGLVLHSHNFRKLAAFYSAVFRLNITEQNDGHILLANKDIELLVLQAPRKIQDISGIPRINAAIKPVYIVDFSMAAVRARAFRKGGTLNPVTAEWRFQGYTVCDGQDCDGNIFQVRSPLDPR